MDWITTSGRTLDEAKSHALDQLGIVADEAEFDVVNDVEKGLFGRVKNEARIRARVRPKQTATKDDRGRRRTGGGGSGRNRNQKAGSRSSKGGNEEGKRGGAKAAAKSGGSNRNDSAKGKSSRDNNDSTTSDAVAPSEQSSKSKGEAKKSGGDGRQGGTSGGNRDKASSPPRSGDQTTGDNGKRDSVDEQMSRSDQEKAAREFLEGVLGAFEMDGSVAVVAEEVDDDAIELEVTGSELGLLVGQKGVTLNALQELTRTVVQRKSDGAKTDRLRVDVAGYRARRTAALRGFAAQIAADVIESGTEKLLEPMGPADRKVVHDAVNEIDGVETGSEGEEPRRRVVIRPL